MTSALSRPLPASRFGAFLAVVSMVALALIFWSAPSATGHNVVMETSPEAGSTTSDSPVDIRIVTNDQLLDLTGTGSGFAIVVRDAGGLYYGDGCVTVGDTDMSATAALGDAGEYTVTFQFVSADGHSLSDSFSFTFDPAPSHTPATGFEQAPVCGVEPIMPITEGDETTATDLESAPDGVVADEIDHDMTLEQDSQRWPITVAVAGVLVILSIALLVWMVRRRNGS